MILTYRILTTLIYPFLVILIFLRKIFHKEDPERYKEKVFISHFNVTRRKNKKLIWFHAASIGELKSIIPIIEKINCERDIFDFLVTTTTVSSSHVANSEFIKFKNVYHRFFPLDVEFLISRFLYLWKPDVIFLVDSEIWPNLIFKAKKNKIPLILINARITYKTFKRWIRFPNTAKKIFNLFDLCLTANTETKKFLTQLNAKNIFFHGNIKLINRDHKINIQNVNENILLKNRFWFAANTHKGEDIFCLKTHLEIKKKYKEIITIIAPRHIDRVKNIESICKIFNLKSQILNKNDLILAGKEIIIINSFGILQNYFKYAKCVFIGKSTVKKLENEGGQNPIDAARLGCKIYHGPFVYNFEESYKILNKLNISKKIETFTELSDLIIEDLTNPNKTNDKIPNLINDLGQKTLTDTMKIINDFLLNEVK